MPSSTRRIARTVRTNPTTPPVISSFANEPCGQRYAPLGAAVPTVPALEQPAAPKHFPFPNIPCDGHLHFEFFMCGFTIISAGLQYIHLYRSVWWLPHSYTNHPLNFYLIDKYLVAFIVIVLTRRLIYMLFCKLLFSHNVQEINKYHLMSILFGSIWVMLLICAYFVMQNHPLVNILYLCYPIFIYIILFGFNVRPLFELVNWTTGTPPPLHACSCNAIDIRREVEHLKTNFNNRMKQILFNAVLNAYYAGFIPCCFAQSALHYDTFWASQHVIFIFISGFVLLTTHILSLRYCDILHRSALHLGTWEKLETGRTMLLVNNTWKDDLLWPYGSLVRYGRDIWRAQGDCNSSEPGNVGLKRFYYIFKNPTDPLSLILLLLVITILYQLVRLTRSSLWHNNLSLTFCLSVNYYILYYVFRDYLISSKLYFEEREMHKKINMR